MHATILSLALLSFPAQQLDATEPGLARHIDARAPEAEALLERLVNGNSGTGNVECVREVGAMLRAEFDGLGFATE